MSIWCSLPHIGTDPTVMYQVSDGMFEVDLGLDGQAKGREPVEQKPERGNVLSYAEGFSNHHPDLTGTHERPAAIDIATIAPWCVPGHNQDGDGFDCTGCGGYHEHPEVGPWLRLEVAAPETLNFWTKAADGGPKVESQGATVLLDRTAAESLRDALTAWLARPHVEPLPTAPPAPTEERPAAEGGGVG